MSDIKCPFCGKKLEPIGTSGQFQCGTWGCDASFNFIATRDVWEYIDRTRKALDYATEMLTRIAVSPETMLEPEKIVPQLAGQALERIKEITKANEQQKKKSEEFKALEMLVKNVFK